MNIQLPPSEPCPEMWPKFVDWMAAKMSEDEINPHHREKGAELYTVLFDVNFRGRQLTHCPFCGVALRMDVPIAMRHEGLVIPARTRDAMSQIERLHTRYRAGEREMHVTREELAAYGDELPQMIRESGERLLADPPWLWFKDAKVIGDVKP